MALQTSIEGGVGRGDINLENITVCRVMWGDRFSGSNSLLQLETELINIIIMVFTTSINYPLENMIYLFIKWK